MDKTNQNQQSKERDIGDLYFFFPLSANLNENHDKWTYRSNKVVNK